MTFSHVCHFFYIYWQAFFYNEDFQPCFFHLIPLLILGFFVFVFWFFETGSHCVAHTGLKL
jgi:hypothetical protein